MTTGDFGTFVGNRDAFQPPPSDRRHYLTTLRGVEPGRRVELGREPLVIGRGSTCSLVIADPELSKRHCSVVLRSGGVVVADLGSTNGTFVEGTRISGLTPLAVDAVLQVGGQLLRHEIRDAAEVQQEAEQAADLRRARTYVQALLPAPRSTHDFQLDYVHEPCATLGGDALGCIDLPGGLVAFYVLDVCGHGAGAAMHSVAVMQHIRAAPMSNETRAQPARILSALNDAFDMEAHDGMFLSIWYGVWDPSTRELRYASAGHPAPLHLAGGGLPPAPLKQADPPIGVVPGAAFRQHATPMEPGSVLVLFSDGAYEIRDRQGRDGTYQDLVRLVDAGQRPHPPTASSLRALVMATSASERLADDLTLLVVTFP